MKMRAVAIFDFDFDTFEDASEEHKILKEALKKYAEESTRVLFWDFELKERRGDRHIPVKDMKLIGKA